MVPSLADELVELIIFRESQLVHPLAELQQIPRHFADSIREDGGLLAGDVFSFHIAASGSVA
jgi:hypothetical protein